MIIYEVNITIKKNIFRSYIEWLNMHINQMMKYDGFLKNEKFQFNDNKDTISVCIHYHIESIEKLNNYLNDNSKEMQKDGMKKFSKNIKINRRVLKTL